MPSALFIKVILSSLLCPHPNRVSLPHSSILLVIIRIHDGEGNSNPLQYSCLENPMDGGAWWAAVHGVAQSQTQLKRLSSSSSSRIHDPFSATAIFLVTVRPKSVPSRSFFFFFPITYLISHLYICACFSRLNSYG